MTPEEHNLSIHLLMIVRRFIGAMRPVGDNSQLPTELFDHIVFHVDSKRDLLSLALTCQRMCSIVSSDHFGYRVVKTKVSLIRVWHHLITRPDLACNIRRLEIIDENERSSESRLILPKIADTSTDAKGTDDKLKFPAKLEKLFVSAVAGMHYLKSFKWSCTTSLISIASLWPTLLKCYQLRLIDLNDNTMFLHPKNGNNLAKEDTATPMELVTTVSVKSIKSSYGTTKDPQLTCIADLVMCFPNLKNLDITYAVPRDPDFFRPIADDFYSCGRWQNLTSLTLNNLWCTSQGLHSLATFLSEHNNLETLHFDSEGIKIAPLATLLLHNTLPRLKELKSNRKFANAILSCTSDVPRPLKTLKGIELSGSESDRTFFDNLTRVGGEISRVELAGWKETDDLRELLNCVPKLTWLDVGYAPNKAANAYNAVSTRIFSVFRDVKILKRQLGPLGDIAHARPRDNDILRCETLQTGSR
ncbi:hypothetical protein BDM02DRAFT_3037143 [Thelephora ganbajun]|uniref:Uncharacterized protein n=1 Tax=Thelephora ganbajun TaxID=370292 RepID=A0ACB6ZAM1_THEGA|nr:hypothetical protein BDM02DRAFT_3037143 [Thelephora ganbajun]